MKEFFKKEYLEIRGEGWKPLSRRNVAALADLIWATFTKAHRYEQRAIEANEGLREWCLPWVVAETKFIVRRERVPYTRFRDIPTWHMGWEHGGDAYYNALVREHEMVVVRWKGSRKLLGKTLQEVVKPEYLEYVAREIGYPLPKEFETASAYQREPERDGLREIISILRRLRTIARKIVRVSEDFRYESLTPEEKRFYFEFLAADEPDPSLITEPVVKYFVEKNEAGRNMRPLVSWAAKLWSRDDIRRFRDIYKGYVSRRSFLKTVAVAKRVGITKCDDKFKVIFELSPYGISVDDLEKIVRILFKYPLKPDEAIRFGMYFAKEFREYHNIGKSPLRFTILDLALKLFDPATADHVVWFAFRFTRDELEFLKRAWNVGLSEILRVLSKIRLDEDVAEELVEVARRRSLEEARALKEELFKRLR